MQEATGKKDGVFLLLYSETDALCASEGERGKRASVGRDGKKEKTKAGERLAFEFPGASTIIGHM